jgi:Zn-finger nucleic acid-binding protein
MNCPIDQTELRIADRQGVEIDYCPQCRGVWLDRGELDKILERAGSLSDPRPAQPTYQPEQPRYREREWDDDDDRYRYDPRRRRRRSFLDDIFDFD